MNIVNDQFHGNLKMLLENSQLFIGFHLPLVCIAIAPRSIVLHIRREKAVVLTAIDGVKKGSKLGEGALVLELHKGI